MCPPFNRCPGCFYHFQSRHDPFLRFRCPGRHGLSLRRLLCDLLRGYVRPQQAPVGQFDRSDAQEMTLDAKISADCFAFDAKTGSKLIGVEMIFVHDGIPFG